MIWRIENIKEEEVIAHSGFVALYAMFASAITALAVYFLI